MRLTENQKRTIIEFVKRCGELDDEVRRKTDYDTYWEWYRNECIETYSVRL